MMEVKKVAEEQEVWDKEEEAARSEAEAKKLVLEKFHKWIKVFGKKQSERMPTRKLCDYAIDVKEEEDVPVIKGEERGSQRIHEGIVEKEIYSAIKVTANSTGVLYREEGWQKEDGIGLQVFK